MNGMNPTGWLVEHYRSHEELVRRAQPVQRVSQRRDVLRRLAAGTLGLGAAVPVQSEPACC